MSEHEGGDSKVGSFLLGFLTGVLVCLGAGSVFFVRQARVMAQMAERAHAAEADARREADAAREQAVRERERVQKALEAERKANAAKGKPGE